MAAQLDVVGATIESNHSSSSNEDKDCKHKHKKAKKLNKRTFSKDVVSPSMKDSFTDQQIHHPVTIKKNKFYAKVLEIDNILNRVQKKHDGEEQGEVVLRESSSSDISVTNSEDSRSDRTEDSAERLRRIEAKEREEEEI